MTTSTMHNPHYAAHIVEAAYENLITVADGIAVAWREQGGVLADDAMSIALPNAVAAVRQARQTLVNAVALNRMDDLTSGGAASAT